MSTNAETRLDLLNQALDAVDSAAENVETAKSDLKQAKQMLSDAQANVREIRKGPMLPFGKGNSDADH